MEIFSNSFPSEPDNVRQLLEFMISKDVELRQKMVHSLLGNEDSRAEASAADLSNDKTLLDLVEKYKICNVHAINTRTGKTISSLDDAFRPHTKKKPTNAPPKGCSPEEGRKWFFDSIEKHPNRDRLKKAAEARLQRVTEGAKILDTYFASKEMNHFLDVVSKGSNGYWHAALLMMALLPHHEKFESGQEREHENPLENPGNPAFEDFRVFKAHWKKAYDALEQALRSVDRAIVNGPEKPPEPQ